MKYFIIFSFFAIFASLGSALFFMKKGGDAGQSKDQKMAFALALRVGLSILLFVCILLAWQLGYIQPAGISSGQ